MAVIRRETDYALRALARLAGEEEGYLSVSALAEEADVSVMFLRKIMQRLHRAHIVASRQGPFGGYRLARPAREISLLDVLEAVQGPLVVNECFESPGICGRTGTCLVRRELGKLADGLTGRLAEITMDQLAAGAVAEKGAAR